MNKIYLKIGPYFHLAAGILSLSTVVAHFGATSIYLLPKNYLTRSWSAPIASYMNTLFYQNWHFFAPDPGLLMDRVVGRCHFDTSDSIVVDPFSLIFTKGSLGPQRHVVGKTQYAHQQIASALLSELRQSIWEECPTKEKDRPAAVETEPVKSTRICPAAVRRLSASAATARARGFIASYCGIIARQQTVRVDIALVREKPVKISNHVKNTVTRRSTKTILSLLMQNPDTQMRQK